MQTRANMNRSITKSVLAISALALMVTAEAAPRFWNTGEGLVSFNRDLNWTAEKIQGSTTFSGRQNTWVMDTEIYPVYGAYNRHNYSNSNWISFARDAYCNSDDIFKFTTKFTIEGNGVGNNVVTPPDAVNYTLKGKYSSDNASKMYLNGHLVTSLDYYNVDGYSFEVARNFDATPYLRNGENIMEILVGSSSTMGANVGPITEWMGLRVEAQLNPVPEPASLACVGLGLLGAIRRKRNRR